jgi:hypothetical protein
VECDKDRPMSDKKHSSGKLILTVAGLDRCGDLGRDICANAKALDDPILQKSIDDSDVVLELGKSANENIFMDSYLKCFVDRTQVDLSKCNLPNGAYSGVLGRAIGIVRNFVWRLLRFSFEWNVFHQNVVNEQQAIALAHEVRLRKRENDDLRKRINELESKSNPGECS